MKLSLKHWAIVVALILPFSFIETPWYWAIAPFLICLYPLLLVMDALALRLAERYQTVWFVGGKVIVVLIFFLVINSVTSSIDTAVDRDEALDSAVSELVSGRYPYYVKTPIHNPLSPMPGAILIAAPFVALGDSAYQNFFWLAVTLLLLPDQMRRSKIVSACIWVILFSPLVFQEFIHGSDLIANNLYVVLVTLWGIKTSDAASPKLGWLRPIAFGILLSSRPNFIFWGVFVLAHRVRWTGFKMAGRWMLLAVCAYCLITLPFYFYDPAAFSPFHVQGKLSHVGFPNLSAVTVFFMLLVSGGLSLRATGVAEMMRAGSVVQAIPVGVALFLVVASGDPYSVVSDRLSYALNFLIPLILSLFISP